MENKQVWALWLNIIREECVISRKGCFAVPTLCLLKMKMVACRLNMTLSINIIPDTEKLGGHMLLYLSKEPQPVQALFFFLVMVPFKCILNVTACWLAC